ncbi:MAG: glutamine-hydrolyzing carbamoyl-phosphate synthase small subunit [Saprospiraceae bacterium]|nr:glutamine-hydrolyzing carbamoyl-phosphate synthase small subunit [Saprospiraceae bacterium]
MQSIEPTKAVLVLANGSVYHGKAAGKIGTATGEICFNTGMTGYQEVFTDPSYYGQIMVTTNAHIGNYGIKHVEDESEKIQIAGLVCKNFSQDYSRIGADEDIQHFFEAQNIVCIYGVDTREIVREIRTGGAMNCIISSETKDVDQLMKQLAEVPDMSGLELSSRVTTLTTYDLGDPDAPIRLAVMDYGTKKNILRNFVQRQCFCRVFPAETPLEEVLAFNPDAFFLSNGPGDPAAMAYAIHTVKLMMKTGKPIFGICLGHQLLALANDIPTHKMHHGHRGINHPVKNLVTGKCEITSQNHGFAIDGQSIYNHPDIEVTHINLNDESIEGLKVKSLPAFSVQYHPEAAPGPHDAQYLFDQFVDLILKSKNN